MDEHAELRRLAAQNEHASAHTGHPALALTAGQRRAIAALLVQVAHAVAHTEAVLGAPLTERLSYVGTRNDLSEDERARIAAAATALVREANALAEVCAIPTQATDVRASLGGEFSILWSDAADTDPSRLIGYGPLRPESAAAITPHVSAIAHLSLLIARRAQGSNT